MRAWIALAADWLAENMILILFTLAVVGLGLGIGIELGAGWGLAVPCGLIVALAIWGWTRGQPGGKSDA